MAVKEVVSRYRWAILGLAFTTQWSNALIAQAVAPLAPLFQPELGLTKAQVGLFSSFAFIGAWAVVLLTGPLTDRVGTRFMTSLGQLVGGLAMAGMSLVGSFFQASLVMLGGGVGRGMVAPGTTKAIMDWFPRGERATAMGLVQAGVPVAGIATASTLPALGLALGWRTALALMGVLIVAGGIACAVLYRDAGRGGPRTERRVGAWAGLAEIIRNRRVWTLSLMAVLFSIVHVSLATYVALYFNEVVLVPLVPDEAARIVAAGGYLALCQLGGASGRIYWGVVSDRLFHGRRRPVVAMMGALSTLCSVAMANLALGHPTWLLAAFVYVYGVVGIGWAGLYQAMLGETVGRRFAGTGVGVTMTLSQFGNVGGPVLFGFLVDLTGSYGAGWLYLGCAAAAGALLAAATSKEEKYSG